MRADRCPAEHLQRRRHGSRIGVVAFIDDKRRAAGKLDCDRRAAAGDRREFGERQRRERKIGADQFGRRQDRERIDDEMAAGRADLVGEFDAEDFRLDGRAARMQRAFDQPRIGRFMLAERNDAGDAGLFGAALEMGELRDIAIDDCRAARLDAEKDLRLGVGDLGRASRGTPDAPARSW